MSGEASDAAAASISAKALDRYTTNESELVGRLLDGRYLVERVLGEGGMALVLGAMHVFLGKRVAIKVLHPALTALDEMKTRFLREARATSAVTHPNVVTVSDFGVSPEGLHYLVMEQLDGQDLHAWLSARGVATVHEASVIAAEVCAALDAIHRAGFVHRDLKPENIFVLADEPGAPDEPAAIDAPALRIKVLDLGIAALVEGPTDATPEGTARRLTRTGQTLGTVHYMSPEQAMGNPVDGRSDLYALGCIAYELVTGTYAFDGATPMDVMTMHVGQAPPSARAAHPEVPLWFDALVLKCLAKKPEARFQSASELRAALLGSLDKAARVTARERPTSRRPTALLDETGPAAPAAPARVPGRLGPSVALFALVALGTAVVVWRIQAAPDAPPQARAELASAAAPPVEPPAAPPVEPSAHVVLARTTNAPPAATPPPTMQTVSAPPPVAHVTLRFEVDPPGALVTRAGAPVGAAPIALEVPRGDAELRFELSAPGRVALVVAVTPNADQLVRRVLAPEPTNAPTRASGKPPKSVGLQAHPAPGDNVPSDKTDPTGKTGKTDPTGKTPDGLWRPQPPPGTSTPP